jgi:hypothetical protein
MTLPLGAGGDVTPETFTPLEIMLCEPALNGSMMADDRAEPHNRAAWTAPIRANEQHAIEELSE